MSAPQQCEAWATTRSEVSSRFDQDYRCPHPAKYRVGDTRPHYSPPERFVCGRHVRPYLMDNGDSARAPWTVEALS